MLLKNYSLNALRVFAVAANAASFKQAAQQLDLSQSAITRHIQTLEEQLGAPLFRRDNRVHALTPAGEVLAAKLLQLFQQIEQSVQQARDCGDEQVTTLRVVVADSLLRWWLASRLADFNAIYPHIRLQLDTYADGTEETLLSDTAQAIQHGSIDLAVLHGRIKDRNLQHEPLYRPTYQVVSSSAQTADTAPYFVVPASDAWQVLTKHHSTQLHAAVVQPFAKNTIGLELLRSLDGHGVVDSLYLQHPQLEPLHRSALLCAPSKHEVHCVLKQRTRHPVAVVAFTKWLQNRIQQSLHHV